MGRSGTGRGRLDGASRQKARINGGDPQSAFSGVVELGGPNVSGPAAQMEHRQTFAGGLPGIAEEINEKAGGDGFAAAKFIHGGFVERCQRHIAPGGNDSSAAHPGGGRR